MPDLLIHPSDHGSRAGPARASLSILWTEQTAPIPSHLVTGDRGYPVRLAAERFSPDLRATY